MAAVVLGQADDATMQRVQDWNNKNVLQKQADNALILKEFGDLGNFHAHLRKTNSSREKWLKESVVSYAVEDAFDYLLDWLLPRGRV